MPKMADLGNFGRLHGNQNNFRGKFESANLEGMPWGTFGSGFIKILRGAEN